MDRFTITKTVEARHIDQMDHVNNVAFLKMVQDIATEHWRVIAPQGWEATMTWFCRRHEIDYLKPGFLGDELQLQTWVGEPSGATLERFTEISRLKDNAILVKCRTVWALIDVNTGRPRRVDASIIAFLPKPT
jgi:acyl-CoA thioester hydrolase